MTISFKNRIDLSEVMGYPLSIEFTNWEEGISWKHISEKGTQVTDYFEDPGFPFSYLINQSNLSSWLDSIPKHVLNLINNFEKTYSRHAFTSIYFASRSKEAEELLVDAPILTWMILEHASIIKLNKTETSNLFKLKRTKILELHGIEPRKAILKFLYNLKLNEFSTYQLELIKKVLIAHDIVKLNRIEFPSIEKLEWLLESPRLIDARFFKTMEEQQDMHEIKKYVIDTLNMAERLRVNNARTRILDCRDLNEITIFHDQLVVQINAIHQTNRRLHEELLKAPFPSPPFEDDLGISAITTFKELELEGQEMQHCISSYQIRIIKGQYYAYKVDKPERATIGLHIVRGKWAIDQIKLACNARPSDETKEHIYKWFLNSRNTINHPTNG